MMNSVRFFYDVFSTQVLSLCQGVAHRIKMTEAAI
jgi:hypothetical protein